MINALGSSLINRGNRILQGGAGRLLVAGRNGSVYLLHGRLYAGLDGLIASSFGLVYQNSLLRRLNVCQSVHLQIVCFFFQFVCIIAGHGRT